MYKFCISIFRYELKSNFLFYLYFHILEFYFNSLFLFFLLYCELSINVLGTQVDMNTSIGVHEKS